VTERPIEITGSRQVQYCSEGSLELSGNARQKVMTGRSLMLESKTKPSFALPELPYEENALEPVISACTLSFHHGKHHAGYVTILNELVEGSPYAGRPLDEVVKRAAGDPAAKIVFNNAAQAWNHDFYWRSMRPRGGGMPSGALRDTIERDLGGLAEFRMAFAKAAAGCESNR
jgi:Fe-Mn family superoxide dismutase